MPKTKIIGAIQEPLNGPGTITHEGGDPILIAEVVSGLPQTERSLVFAGEDIRENFDDQVFTPAPVEQRQEEIGEAVLIRSLGQASFSFEEKKVVVKKESKVA